MMSIVLGIDRILLGSLGRLLWANSRVTRTLSNLVDRGICDNDKRLELPDSVLEENFDADKRRLERIEDKAKNNVFVVAIAISVLTAGIGFYGKDSPLADECLYIKGAAAILLIAAMIYLLLSALFSLHSYRVGRIYYPELDDRPELSGDKEWQRVLLLCIELNRKIITIRGNCLTSSMNCLANGIVAVAIFFFLVLWTLF